LFIELNRGLFLLWLNSLDLVLHELAPLAGIDGELGYDQALYHRTFAGLEAEPHDLEAKTGHDLA
jgi:hypothetical protein